MKMIKTRIEILFMLFFILLGSCEKEDYTLPVDFRLNFSIDEKPVMNGMLTIDAISLGLKSIDINGYREIGGDVFLTRSFNPMDICVIRPNTSNETIHLDIPQGVYNPISFLLVYQPDESETYLSEDIEEWLQDVQDGDDDLEDLQEDLGDIIEDYIENIEPCILVKGKFISNLTTKHVILAVNDPLTFQILSKNRNGESEVILDKNIINNGNLNFDPSYWFSVITPEMLNGAFIGVIDETNYIFLSKYVNSQIYNAVFNRIEESTSLTINE
jgi:hypothetical protein